MKTYIKKHGLWHTLQYIQAAKLKIKYSNQNQFYMTKVQTKM